MYIEKLHINTFAGVDELTLELEPGLNIIEGRNESGKSTIVAFIKFMLYSASPKEREVIASWRSGGAAGSMIFTARDGSAVKRFRIERALVSVGDDNKLSWRESSQLIELETGTVRHKGKLPGEIFLGVDSELFESTAFISQLGGAEPDHAKASDSIENLLFSADESVDTSRALSKLDAARVAILHKNEKGGRLFELNNHIAELETRLDGALKLSNEIRTKEAQLADLRTAESAAREKSERLDAKCRQFEVRSLLGLFDKLHAAEEKCESLQNKEASRVVGADKSGEKNSFRVLAEQIRKLGEQVREHESRRIQIPQTSEELAHFEELGGRSGIDEIVDSKRSRARFFRIFAIIAILLAIAAGAMLLVPTPEKLQTVMLMLCGLFGAVGLVLLIASIAIRSAGDKFASGFDIDALETEQSERETAREAQKLSDLSLADLRRRYAAAVRDGEELVGAQSDMQSLLIELEIAGRNSDSRTTELAKYRSIVETMRAQLAGHDEDELRSRLDDTDISDVDMTNLSALRREVSFEARRAQSQGKFATELEKSLAGLYAQTEDASKLSDRLGAARLERDRLSSRLAAIKLAQAKLTEASERLRSSVAPRLAADASRILSSITDGKYSELGVATSLEASIETSYGRKSASYLSAGTRDAVYLALRIALCRLVFRLEEAPLICDESFARLDDERSARMLTVLGEVGQTIVTTSTEREARLCDKLTVSGSNVHVIRL